MSPNKKGEQGITLIEFVIGAGLLGIVIFIGANVIQRLQKTSKQDQSALHTQKQVTALFNLVKRDAKVQINNGLAVGSGNLGLVITRLARQADNESSAYSVALETTCQPFPATSQTALDGIYTVANRNQLYNDPHSCLKLINCPAGKFPQVQVRFNSSEAASYPQTVFPLFHTSPLEGALGFALCSKLIGDQVQIVIEAVLAPGNGATGRVSVQQKVFIVPLKSADDMTILPN